MSLDQDLQQKLQQALQMGASPDIATREAQRAQSSRNAQKLGQIATDQSANAERLGNGTLGGALHYSTFDPESSANLTKLAPLIVAAGAAPFTGGLSLAGMAALTGTGTAAAELARQVGNHEQIDVGNVAKQGAIAGASDLVGGAIGGKIASTVGSKLAGTALGDNLAGVGSVLGQDVKNLGNTAEVFNAGKQAAQTASKLSGLDGIVGNDANNIFTKAGNSLKQSALNPKVAASPFGAEEEARLTDVAMNQLGLKGSPQQMYSQLGGKFDELNGQIASQLSKSNATVHVDDVLGNITKNLDNNFAEVDSKALQTLQDNLSKISDANGNIKVQDLFEYKKKLGNVLKRAFSKLDSPTAVLTPKESTALEGWKSMASTIGDLEPAVSNATKLQSDIFDLAPGLAKARTGAARATIFGTNVPVSNNVIGGAKNAVGTGLQKVGGITLNPKKVSSGLPSLLSGAVNANNSVGQPMQTGAPSLDSLTSATSNQTGSQNSSLPSLGGVTLDQVRRAKILDALNGGRATAQLNALESALMGGAGKLSDTAIGSVNDFNSALNALDDLQNTMKSNPTSGPFLGRLKSLNPYDTQAQGLQASINLAKQIVGKALEGGVLRKEDEEKYAKILPTVSDTPEVANNKLNSVRALIQQKAQQYMQLQNSRGTGQISL